MRCALGVWTGPEAGSGAARGRGRGVGDSGNPGVSLNGDHSWCLARSCWESRQKGRALYQPAHPGSWCSVPQRRCQDNTVPRQESGSLSVPQHSLRRIKTVHPGKSPVTQSLGLGPLTVRAWVQSLVGELRFRKPWMHPFPKNVTRFCQLVCDCPS